MPAPCWALPWALRLNTETNNARSLPLVSSQSGVSHTAMTSKCLRVAEGMVSQGTPPHPPPFAFVLTMFWDLEGEGEQRERARSWQGWTLCLAAEDSHGKQVLLLLERGTQNYEKKDSFRSAPSHASQGAVCAASTHATVSLSGPSHPSHSHLNQMWFTFYHPERIRTLPIHPLLFLVLLFVAHMSL